MPTLAGSHKLAHDVVVRHGSSKVVRSEAVHVRHGGISDYTGKAMVLFNDEKYPAGERGWGCSCQPSGIKAAKL
jgi:hypothetical protein